MFTRIYHDLLYICGVEAMELGTFVPEEWMV